ncbi:MAG: NAD-dependent epimerase/dehydratase family protein [Lachnospiraceae bacterium]|nr:NAD-dependent epimerase/dehydratase family protein [Lachnospiraceae bacterium]
MKILLIGGTGTISMAISRKLLEQGHNLFLLNRGTKNQHFSSYKNMTEIKADINDEAAVYEQIKDLEFDSVVDFIAFVPAHLERDVRLFYGRTKQFIFISSASAYQKPPSDYHISEGTPLSNPYWEYSRNKIAGEEYLMKYYRDEGFPVTIVRPSHTYSKNSVPLGVHGDYGSFQVIKRMMEEKPVIIHGDGTSLWTMTHANDFAEGFVGLLGNIHAIGEAVQITSDENLTWNQIYQSIADALGVPLKPYYVSSEFLNRCSNYDFRGSLIGDKANTVVFDNTKLKRLVPDFVAKKRFDQGIKEALFYILAHPELQIIDPNFDAWCDRVIKELDTAAERIVKY